MKNGHQIIKGACEEVLKFLRTGSVDLVITSPPYEDCRTYGIDFKASGQVWVDWIASIFRECVRVSKGLTAFVVEGKTRKFVYSATPFLLIADLHRSGVCLRKPMVYKRSGIPGSGGPDYLRNDWEPIIFSCASFEPIRPPPTRHEAPYPESLVERLILSFCPPGGIVLDPFGGSGTTAAVAIKHGRRAISIDVRDSQIELMERRTEEASKIRDKAHAAPI